MLAPCTKKSKENKHIVPVVMNKVWRIFCNPGTKLVELCEYRGTKLLSGREFILSRSYLPIRSPEVPACLLAQDTLRKLLFFPESNYMLF